jgi:hypothetical protein
MMLAGPPQMPGKIIPNNDLIITISYDSDQITRKFEQSCFETEFGLAFQRIKDNSDSATLLARAYNDAQKSNFPELKEILVHKLSGKAIDNLLNFQPVPWYYYQFFSALKTKYDPNRFSSYIITVKACREHHFYKLEGAGKSGNERTLIHMPYFEKAPPPDRSDNPEQIYAIRGFYDLLFLLGPSILSCNGLREELCNLISWFRVELHLMIGDIRESTNVISIPVRVTVSMDKYLNLPPKNKRILVSSPNVRAAIKSLSEVWMNPVAKSVLISGWIGSGKEVLVDLLIAAKVLRDDQFVRLSAAELGKFERVSAELQRHLNLAPKQPLLLFLDEIHHNSAEDVRSGLLRLMETNELAQQTGNPLDCHKVLYVLAASLPPDKLRSINPPDLWTRIGYTVVLKHPLLIRDKQERGEILKDYFELFWTSQLNEWDERNNNPSQVEILSDPTLIGSLSSNFANELASPLIPLVSISVLRNIVDRLFYKTVDYLRVHTDLRGKAQAKGAALALGGNFGNWVEDIFLELAQQSGGEF